MNDYVVTSSRGAIAATADLNFIVAVIAINYIVAVTSLVQENIRAAVTVNCIVPDTGIDSHDTLSGTRYANNVISRTSLDDHIAHTADNDGIVAGAANDRGILIGSGDYFVRFVRSFYEPVIGIEHASQINILRV